MAIDAPPRLLSVLEFERAVEAGVFGSQEHLELIDGQVLVVTPQGPAHADVAARLADRLRHVYGTGYVIRSHSPLVSGVRDLPEPEIAVVREGDYRMRHPRAEEAVLVVEIAQTSQQHDRAKAALYATGGCPTYWLLDLAAEELTEHAGARGGGYARVQVLDGEETVGLPNLSDAQDTPVFTVRELLGLP